MLHSTPSKNRKLRYRVGERFPVAGGAGTQKSFSELQINWLGPFESLHSARHAVRELGIDRGFFDAIGRPPWFGGRVRRMFGVTENLHSCLVDSNRSFRDLSNRDLQLWVGGPSTEQETEIDVSEMKRARWLLAHALAPRPHHHRLPSALDRRLVIQNSYQDPHGKRLNAHSRLHPHIVDFAYNPEKPGQPTAVHLYWLDHRNRIIGERQAQKITPHMRFSANERHSARHKSSGLLNDITTGLAALALFAIASYYGYQSTAVAPDAEDSEPVAADRTNELEDALAKFEDLAREQAGEIERLNEKTASLATENSDLRAQNKTMEDAIDAARQEYTRAGLDDPPCWYRTETDQPDYLFNAMISRDGIFLEKGFLDHSNLDYDNLPTDGVTLNKALSVDEFRSNVAPIYGVSADERCRHFVRMYEGEHDSVSVYKAQRQAIEDNFYILRRLQIRD